MKGLEKPLQFLSLEFSLAFSLKDLTVREGRKTVTRKRQKKLILESSGESNSKGGTIGCGKIYKGFCFLSRAASTFSIVSLSPMIALSSLKAPRGINTIRFTCRLGLFNSSRPLHLPGLALQMEMERVFQEDTCKYRYFSKRKISQERRERMVFQANVEALHSIGIALNWHLHA